MRLSGPSDSEIARAAAEDARAARVEEIIVKDHAASEETDEIRRIERLSGRRCPCCDNPLPPGWPGHDCADCAELAL